MKWIRRFGWGAGALLLLWAATWLALPALIKWQLPLRASEALGRAVTVGDVAFRPWRLDLTLDDLAIAALPPGAEPLLQVARVHIDVSASSLFRGAPVIEALELDAPRLRITRTAAGRYDIDDLIDRFAPRPDAPPPGAPARFALYNVQVRDARLRLDDRPVQRVQQVEALQLALPFISNLPAQVDIQVEPRLAFRLNGTPFDSGAQATPFAQTRNGDIKLALSDLDLAPYLGYLPASLPLRVTKGSISADLALNFAAPAGSPPRVTVRGSIGSKDLALTDPAGAPLAGWQRLRLGLTDVQPLARGLAFGDLRIDGLRLHAARDAAGRINLLGLAGAGASAPAPTPAAPGPAASTAAPVSAPASAWRVSLGSVALADARVLWNDAAVRPAVALQLDGLAVEARKIEWPPEQPVTFAVKGALRNQAPGAPTLAEFSADGPVTDREAQLAVKLSSVTLAGFAPYLAQALVPSVEGQLAAQAVLDWSGAAEAPRLRLSLDRLVLDNLALREGSGRSAQAAVALKQLALADVQVDLLARSVALGEVRLVQPALQLVRDAQGALNVQQWAAGGPATAPVKPAAPAAMAATAAAASSAPATGAWKVQLKDLLIEGGQLRFADTVARVGVGEPVRVELSGLRVAVQNLEWHGERALPAAAVQLGARVGGSARDRQRPAGLVEFKGKVGVQPLLAIGNLRVERVPVPLFKPYFADLMPLNLLRAEVGYSGSVSLRQLPAGLDVAAAGDVLLGDVHITRLPERGAPANLNAGDELLTWQALALTGMKVAIKPQARPQIEIAEAALTDFYSRLVITDAGRFNLQDVAAAPPGALPPGAAASAPLTIVDAPKGTEAAASARSASVSPSPSTPASGPPAEGGSRLPLDLKIGATRLTNGRVDFTDRFVRPNYSAALTELNGRLGAFNSGSREMATLELRGRAAGTALLEIGGQLNPTVQPLALDIRAKASDLELAPLSPYAGKYAGYAIERGKLTLEVAYKIDPDGKLDAKNRVVLNQLTFGDKIDSKDATQLPVLLAVALLKDRNGVIDIDLPVSGSLKDPQFSVGGIVWKVVVNLLTRAVTAPFSLLAGGGGGGGGDDLSAVEFMPGTAQIAAASAGAIDKVAKALAERPSLKVTVTGAADPATEREAVQQAAVEARLAAERRRDGLRGGAGASAEALATANAQATEAAPESPPPPISTEERARWLKQVYKDTELPGKPRNAIGFAKDLPGPEMEALLKARVPVTAEALRELALQRSMAVRDALIAKGLPSERLFLAAPKLRAAGDEDAGWKPRVQLTLTGN